jgi:rSAM/selenodomain-associated transferase 2
MRVSIIIPTLNEAGNIAQLLSRLTETSSEYLEEIIVVDGGSTDDTCQIVRKLGVKVMNCPKRGRAFQMNVGAHHSSGDVLYFIHGDTLPPTTYLEDIGTALGDGHDMGCYRFKFDGKRWLLRINSFFTRYNKSWCRGGDQSLFVKKEVFNALGGYREDYVIMEDFELLRRAVGKYRFCVMPKEIIVSDRKYKTNNYLQVQLANLIVFNMFKRGYAPQKILKTYRRMIDYRS